MPLPQPRNECSGTSGKGNAPFVAPPEQGSKLSLEFELFLHLTGVNGFFREDRRAWLKRVATGNQCAQPWQMTIVHGRASTLPYFWPKVHILCRQVLPTEMVRAAEDEIRSHNWMRSFVS